MVRREEGHRGAGVLEKSSLHSKMKIMADVSLPVDHFHPHPHPLPSLETPKAQVIEFDVTYYMRVERTSSPGFPMCVCKAERVIAGSLTRLFIYSAVPLAVRFPHSTQRQGD